MKIPFNFKSSLVFVSLFFFAQSIAAEKPPWDYDNNIYLELLQNSDDEMLLNKSTQFDVCGTMARNTDQMAVGVQINKERPEFIRNIILDFHPMDNGDFRDVINQKIMDMAFEMADLADGDKSSDDSVVAHAAWDWCIAQEPEHFAVY
ncbi:hypothetical protein [Shewanella sp. 10N.286.52.B9]|uniref:hypothetical protein n=1 Tax=Shewanella sp. 10N.286.52.B9 TaxID=1880837 RepID=UPI000C830441|nr:hypothetical protein [Shewanella sp. 10N.286.52.B9]PMG43573.1 hypothetical protein BCU91_04645 [Shewanella sp. 10N.286.52.B9]